jgi:hypothetical protein
MRPLILFLASAAALAQLPPPAAAPAAAEIERQQLRRLLTLRRVYVDRLAGGETADQIRSMVIAALERSRLFILTEDESKADAYLRGSAEDLIFTDTRAYRDGLNIRAQSRVSSRRGGVVSSGSSANSVSSGVSVGENEDHYSRERRHEAVAAVRLVAKDGDVLWSATQESLGAKYRGSAADVAEKLSKDLAAAYARARKLAAAAGPPPPR